MTIADAVEAFLADLERSGRSASTVRNYRADLSALLRSGKLPAGTAGVARLVERHLKGLRLAGRSWNRHLATLRRFCEYLVREGLLPANPLRGVRQAAVAAPRPEPLGARQLAALMERMPHPRDRALVGLLADTGVRIGEALRLRVQDVDVGAGRVIVRNGVARAVELPARTRRLVAAYLRARRAAADEPLFVAHGKRPLSYAGAHRIFRRYAADLGITMRSLRADAAAKAFRRGESLGQVQRRLGHMHAASTLRYHHDGNNLVNRARAARRGTR
jgi:site-specific recombinase XerD